MRTLFVICTTLMLSFSFGQTYTVIHSIGKIKDTNSNTYLTKGSRVNESAALKFETKGARAAVLSSSRGRFVIQEQARSASQSDLTYTLSSVLSPVRGRLSTRAGGINNQLDFGKHFAEAPIAVLGGNYSVSISPNSYPMNENQFFYAQYSFENERINKKLSNNADTLIFDMGLLFMIDNESIEPRNTSDMQLFYFDSEKQESTLVTDLRLNIVSNDDLRSLSTSLEEEEDKNEALLSIINDLYGKCSMTYLQKTLSALDK